MTPLRQRMIEDLQCGSRRPALSLSLPISNESPVRGDFEWL